MARTVLKVAVVALALLSPPRSHAQVACTSPDVLCTGDPCVVQPIVVAPPCDLDFGARTLNIANAIRVSPTGAITLRAGNIIVEGPISNSGTDGGDVTLVALGTLRQTMRIDVSGDLSVGTIFLQSGGDMLLDGKTTAAGSRAGFANGGSVIVRVGGTLTGGNAFESDVRTFLAGGHAGVLSYYGDAGVIMDGHIHILGPNGGFVEFVSANGPVSIDTDLRTRVFTGRGSDIVLDAATTATIVRRIQADGITQGGSLTVTAPTVVMPHHQALRARASRGVGGTVTIRAGVLDAVAALAAGGSMQGGIIDVVADSVKLTGGIFSGGAPGGRSTVIANTGPLELGGIFDIRSGGTIIATALAGNLTARGAVRGVGCVALTAPAGTVDTTGLNSQSPIVGSCP